MMFSRFSPVLYKVRQVLSFQPMILPKRFDIFTPCGLGMLIRSRCVQIFLSSSLYSSCKPAHPPQVLEVLRQYRSCFSFYPLRTRTVITCPPVPTAIGVGKEKRVCKLIGQRDYLIRLHPLLNLYLEE